MWANCVRVAHTRSSNVTLCMTNTVSRNKLMGHKWPLRGWRYRAARHRNVPGASAATSCPTSSNHPDRWRDRCLCDARGLKHRHPAPGQRSTWTCSQSRMPVSARSSSPPGFLRSKSGHRSTYWPEAVSVGPTTRTDPGVASAGGVAASWAAVASLCPVHPVASGVWFVTCRWSLRGNCIAHCRGT